MARSVSIHKNSVQNVFLHGISFGENIDYSDFDSEDEDVEEPSYDYFNFSEFIDDLRGVIQSRYPSFSDIDSWSHREDHEILENSHALVSVSEYCGLISVSLAFNENSYESGKDTLAQNWCGQVADNFQKIVEKAFPEKALRKLGSFSNGEAVFAPVSRPDGVVSSKDGVLW